MGNIHRFCADDFAAAGGLTIIEGGCKIIDITINRDPTVCLRRSICFNNSVM
jgi:hypothetical protein